MTWPTDDLSTTHFDAGGDSPREGRSVLKRAIDILKAILAARGANNGICDLDSKGRVPGDRIGKGLANGVCELDHGALVPAGRMPPIRAVYEWSGSQLRLRNPDARVGPWVNLKGLSGPRGPQGGQGPEGPKGDRGPVGPPGDAAVNPGDHGSTEQPGPESQG